jgi:hypothetical protein
LQQGGKKCEVLANPSVVRYPALTEAVGEQCADYRAKAAPKNGETE